MREPCLACVHSGTGPWHRRCPSAMAGTCARSVSRTNGIFSSYNVLYQAFKRLAQGDAAPECATMFHATAGRVDRRGVEGSHDCDDDCGAPS